MARIEKQEKKPNKDDTDLAALSKEDLAFPGLPLYCE